MFSSVLTFDFDLILWSLGRVKKHFLSKIKVHMMFSHDVYQYKLTQKVTEPKSSIFRLLWDLKSTKGIIKGKCWKKIILIFGLFLLVIMIKIINIWNGGIKLVNLIPILLYFVTFYDCHKCNKMPYFVILWHLWQS